MLINQFAQTNHQFNQHMITFYTVTHYSNAAPTDNNKAKSVSATGK